MRPESLRFGVSVRVNVELVTSGPKRTFNNLSAKPYLPVFQCSVRVRGMQSGSLWAHRCNYKGLFEVCIRVAGVVPVRVEFARGLRPYVAVSGLQWASDLGVGQGSQSGCNQSLLDTQAATVYPER